MNHYLKQYRLLKDDSMIELYDLSKPEVESFINSSILKSFDGFKCYVKDNLFLLQSSVEQDGGFVFKSIDEIERMRTVGIKPHSIFTSFCPNPETLLKNINSHINKLIETLKLNISLIDFSERSLHAIEQQLCLQKFQYRQEVERHYLGVLAYSGECMIKAYNAKWSIFKEEDKEYASWTPYIELANGEMIASFTNLHQGMLLYGDNSYIPTISINRDIGASQMKFPSGNTNPPSSYYWHSQEN